MAPTLPSIEEAHDALGVVAVLAVGAGGEALLAEPELGGLDVAVGGLERLLAVHHPGAGCLAQRLDVLCGERHGDQASVFSVLASSAASATASAGASAATGSSAATGASVATLASAAALSGATVSLDRRQPRERRSRWRRSPWPRPTAPWQRPGGRRGRPGPARLRRALRPGPPRTRPPPRRVRSTGGGGAGLRLVAMNRPSSTASAMTRASRLFGADGVVVAGDRVLHDFGVDVGVDDGDHRDTELVGLGDRDVLLLRVEHEDRRRGALVMPRRPPRLRCSFSSSAIEQQGFLLGHRVELARGLHALVLEHLADALGDRVEVGEHAAEPTLVDVRHAALLGVAAHRDPGPASWCRRTGSCRRRRRGRGRSRRRFRLDRASARGR